MLLLERMTAVQNGRLWKLCFACTVSCTVSMCKWNEFSKSWTEIIYLKPLLVFLGYLLSQIQNWVSDLATNKVNPNNNQHYAAFIWVSEEETAASLNALRKVAPFWIHLPSDPACDWRKQYAFKEQSSQIIWPLSCSFHHCFNWFKLMLVLSLYLWVTLKPALEFSCREVSLEI